MWFLPSADYAAGVNGRHLALVTGQPVELDLADVAPIIRDAGSDILGPPIPFTEVAVQHIRRDQQTRDQAARERAVEQAIAAWRHTHNSMCPGIPGQQTPHPWHGRWSAVEHRGGWTIACADCLPDLLRRHP